MADGERVVVIVEPDAVLRDEYEVALARAGFRAASTSDGTSALRLANRLVPDSVVTEIVLPTIDGFHLAQRLRRQPLTRDVGIVAITAYSGDDLARRAAECGIDTVL